jgi:hypothetical protein
MKYQTVEEREGKKVIQNYVTTILYLPEFNEKINNSIKNASLIIWKELLDTLYKDEGWSDIYDLETFWNGFYRFFLKGGKATLQTI